MVNSLRTLKVQHFLSFVTMVCPLATIDLVGDNRNMKYETYFEVLYLLLREKALWFKV